MYFLLLFSADADVNDPITQLKIHKLESVFGSTASETLSSFAAEMSSTAYPVGIIFTYRANIT